MAEAGTSGILQLVLNAGLMVQGVLLILALFSVFCWAIIFLKFFQIRRAGKDSEAFLKAFWAGETLERVYTSTKRMKSCPLAQVFQAGYEELGMLRQGRKRSGAGDEREAGIRPQLMGAQNVARAMRQASTSEINRLTRYLPFLATTGSTAPFIGLFGTVWGIMNSFRELALQQSAGLDVVAPGISEALIATAAGLAAAIPAVVAYNFYLTRIKVTASEIENFSSEFLNIVERHFIKK